MARITEPRPAPTSASRGAAAATVDEAASSSSGGSSPDLGPVDLNLTEEEQAFLAREALGSLPPSEVPDVAGPKLVDAIPETIFMSADDVRAAARRQEEEEGEDEIFKAAILVVPFSFCYLLMDILIHQQYGRHPSVKDEIGRLATAVPALSLLVFYSNRYASRRLTQYLLFGLCCLAGSRLIWVLNKAGWLVVIQQAPPLSTLWILAITQLELGLAVGGLAAVFAFTWWKGLSIVL